MTSTKRFAKLPDGSGVRCAVGLESKNANHIVWVDLLFEAGTLRLLFKVSDVQQLIGGSVSGHPIRFYTEPDALTMHEVLGHIRSEVIIQILPGSQFLRKGIEG